MDKLFTPKTLIEFYAAAPSDSAMPEFKDGGGRWSVSNGGPHLASEVSSWRWSAQKKVVDMSCLVGSGILCEFTNSFARVSKGSPPLGFLEKLHTDQGAPFEDDGACNWQFCAPKMDYWHSWQGGDECPLPEGVRYKVMLREGSILEGEKTNYWGWDCAPITEPADVIAFRIDSRNPLHDDYVWPHEVDS